MLALRPISECAPLDLAELRALLRRPRFEHEIAGYRVAQIVEREPRRPARHRIADHERGRAIRCEHATDLRDEAGERLLPGERGRGGIIFERATWAELVGVEIAMAEREKIETQALVL